MAKAGCVVSRTELVSELKNLNVLLDARLLISPSTICVTRTCCKKHISTKKYATDNKIFGAALLSDLQ